ncbi:MtnX-like HAD-IB family phosphatase [Orbus sturtevantii]|uniref:MtnX-like HAD-IB family phosphatase n=1 Tax=Orbus sturtevantii TaxID=3074109 RepID=UPI00370D9848
MNYFVPIIKNMLPQNHTRYGDESARPIILCDFDGTISLKDVTDLLLSHFGNAACDELEAQWEAGIIGSQECMSKQIALMNATQEQLDAVLAQVTIDASFKDFVKYAKDKNFAIHVVSDGLDYAIHTILKHNQLDFLPIFANRLLHDHNHSWKLEFPYANDGCIKASGNCKCQHLKLQRQHFNTVYYVGDGASDYCISNRVDLVFAKDKLIQYCLQNAIRHYPITYFADIIPLLESIQPIRYTNQ